MNLDFDSIIYEKSHQLKSFCSITIILTHEINGYAVWKRFNHQMGGDLTPLFVKFFFGSEAREESMIWVVTQWETIDDVVEVRKT